MLGSVVWVHAQEEKEINFGEYIIVCQPHLEKKEEERKTKEGKRKREEGKNEGRKEGKKRKKEAKRK